MLVSIIIPALNCEKTIERCMKSVCSQTFKNIEIICVDDCSADDSKKIIQNFAKTDKRVSFIRHDKNLGVSASRNDGIKMSRGDYLMFVDADDYIENETVEKLVEYATSHDCPDFLRYNFISTNTVYKNDLYNIKNRFFNAKDDKGEAYRAIFIDKQRIPAYSWLLFIKRQIVQQIRFDTNVGYLEDLVFLYDLIALANTFAFLDLRLYHYSDNCDSVTRAEENTPKKIDDMIYVCKKISKWDKIGIEDRRTAIARILNLMAALLMKLGAYNYSMYRATIQKISAHSKLKDILDSSDSKEINIVKRNYLRVISVGKMGRLYLWIGKMRYKKQ